jgi:hypothetical protein
MVCGGLVAQARSAAVTVLLVFIIFLKAYPTDADVRVGANGIPCRELVISVDVAGARDSRPAFAPRNGWRVVVVIVIHFGFL